LLRLESEAALSTFAYPQQGGLNGVRTNCESEFASGTIGIDAFHSRQENIDHRLTVGAGKIDFVRGPTVVQTIFTDAQLRSKVSNELFRQRQVAAAFRNTAGLSHVRAELAAQFNPDNGPVDTRAFGASFEGRYQKDTDNIRWAVWRYSDEFVNLLGGGRAASLSEQIHLENVDLSFSERRVSQGGALVRSAAGFGGAYTFETAVEVARQRGRKSVVALQAGLQRALQSGVAFEILYGSREVSRSSKREYLRAQIRRNKRDFTWRAYLEYIRPVSERSGITVFGRMRKTFRSQIQVEVWGNWSRVASGDPGEHRVYAYTRVSAPLMEIGAAEQLQIATKFAYQNRFNTAGEKRLVTRLELEASW
jgi:hypothetical protein